MYDPKVSVIWEIIGDFFEARGCPMDTVFYDTYELQVDGLVRADVDVAWNSPLAWLDSLRQLKGACRAVAMRDTDRDRVSYVVARAGGPAHAVEDLRGKTLAVGALDSPQARLIPLGLLRASGLTPDQDVTVRRFDVLVGKHGDHIGGEKDAFTCLERGDAAASVMLDLNWDAWTRDGTIDPAKFQVVGRTPLFDHCVFTTRPEIDKAAEAAWLEALFAMKYDNPEHREMMDLEGLKAWMPGRTTGFSALSKAVASERFFESLGR